MMLRSGLQIDSRNAQTQHGNATPSVKQRSPVLESMVSNEKRSISEPSMQQLSQKVRVISQESSWWELFGVDWTIITFWEISFFVGVWLLSFNSRLYFAVGMLLMGLNYGMIKTKGSHLAAHNALCHSKRWGKVWKHLFLEFQGTFSVDAACDIHIKVHHPYTNVIGLGDSSTWRAPYLPCYIYMFIAPLVLPLLTPVVGLGYLVQERRWRRLSQCSLLAFLGLASQTLLVMAAAKLSAVKAVLVLLLSRCVMEIPYLHINIFQHIGLPMYDKNNKPPRLHLMANGALNLTRTWLLDLNFGHSLINCHTEHHLFPQLSDNMCLKIKPAVQEYLQRYGLPYHEKDYTERLHYFIKNYKDLMVKMPPITEFVGIQ